MITENQINPEDDQQEEIIPTEEEKLKEEVEKIAEQDPDEAVHLNTPTISEENKVHDADDAVHKTVTPSVVAEDINKQIDPDDAVHGK